MYANIRLGGGVKYTDMKTIKELQRQLKLSDRQTKEISVYINGLVIELLGSLKDDTLTNFEETIEALKKVG